MRFLNSFFLSGHSGGFVKEALSAVSHTQMSLRINQALGSLPSPAVSPDPLVASLDSVFLQTHVWSANWGSCGFSREGRTADPAARPLLGHLRLRLQNILESGPCYAGKSHPLFIGWYAASLPRLGSEAPVAGRYFVTAFGLLQAGHS